MDESTTGSGSEGGMWGIEAKSKQQQMYQQVKKLELLLTQ